jgi:hypothetical protein
MLVRKLLLPSYIILVAIANGDAGSPSDLTQETRSEAGSRQRLIIQRCDSFVSLQAVRL